MVVAEMSAVVDADAARLWQAWRPGFEMRPREDESDNRDVYPLAIGLRIPVVLVAFNEMRNWTVEHRLPGGRLSIDHWMSPTADGRVEIGKRLEVRGPMAVPYRFVILPAVRRAWPREVADLQRRAAQSG